MAAESKSGEFFLCGVGGGVEKDSGAGQRDKGKNIYKWQAGS